MISVGHTETERVQRPVVPPLSLPHYTDPGSEISLGLCLRTNIFPGAASTGRSLSHDSFIRHPLPAWPTDPQLWYGYKTNEMTQWTERNIMNQKLSKALMRMEKRDTAK
ncbi:testis-expressed protein 33 [Cynoglossus semilaevis]|uniref:testis-expressed protein 33 n=1 Tax=Cynoglossus semilaevis TaxID=244447 RepID=UPI000495DC6A|nr:testis-expressed protein 33 [Cynoglossus semilaevis]